MNSKFADIKKAIDSASSVLITSHKDPDGDSLGSMLAMYNYVTSLGKKAVALNDGEIPGKYKFFPGIEKVSNVDDYANDNTFDLNIILECPTIDRSGKVKKYVSADIKTINIDHHPDNIGYGEIIIVDAKASAVGEILTEYFIEIGYEIPSDSANLLYSAILTDTGRFRFESTTSKTLMTAGKLIEYGADPRNISDYIYYSIPSKVLKLTGKILSELNTYDNGKICLISLEKNMLNGSEYNASDTEGMAEFVMYDRTVQAGGFLREIEPSKTKVSLRSIRPYDVSSIAHKYGGGGHLNAAGYTIELPIAEVREKLLSELQELINGAV